MQLVMPDPLLFCYFEFITVSCVIMLIAKNMSSRGDKMGKISVLKLGLLIGIFWSLLSIALVEIAYLYHMKMALLELDFRPVTTLFLSLAWVFDLQAHFSPLIRAAEHGFSFTLQNIFISSFLGFIDGFADGVLIAWIYNSLQHYRKSINSFNVLNFGSSTGIVFGLSCLLLALVTYLYDYGPERYGYNYRPLSLVLMLVERINLLDGAGTLFRHSYSNFPECPSGILEWLGWGMVDGFIIGSIVAFLLKLFKKKI
jgi:hypothetical protein